MRGIGQIYIKENRPSSYSPDALFAFCVRTALEKNIFSEAMMHNQWASALFGYERNSSMRIDYMSIVKREYSIYFTHDLKYSFLRNKIERDFPELLGIEEEEDDTEYTTNNLIQDTIKVLNREIIEQKDPHNIESFKGGDLSLVRRHGKNYIYQVKLLLSDGQEPHFHEGIPFILYVSDKYYSCEAVEYDYESGLFFFTSHQFLISSSHCRIMLDSSFILEGLKKRLEELKEGGIDEDLPFAKFLFEETEDLKDVEHKEVPRELSERLDMPQKEAFYAALNKDITFIWGPPGTGKSFTLASIIYALFVLGEDRTAICCLSNVAVDQLLCKVLDIIDDKNQTIEPGNIYRAGRTIDARILSTDYLFPRDHITMDLRKRIKSNMDTIQKLKEREKEASEESIILKAENKDLREQLKEHTEFLVNSSRIVFSTISNYILNNSLYESEFDNLIVDEASMMSMPSLLALGSRISKRLILVGDFQQLSPIALVKDIKLTDSVFEMTEINVNNTSHPALYQLLNQRRSNEKIVDLINKTFYEGKLIPSAKEEKKIVDTAPFAGKIIALKRVGNGAVRFTKGGTRQNKVFAENVLEILDTYNKDQTATFTIGVITPYKGQVSLLRALKHERKYSAHFDNRVKIGTIHTFQGSECDVIIFDMVDCHALESGRKLQIGKIYAGKEGERLLNVAISRARHKLIVVCDPTYISNIPGNTITLKSRSIFNRLSRY